MKSPLKSLVDRPSVASGRFYSANADKLEIDITNFITEARELCQNQISDDDDLMALIAPHAGYVFSGVVATSAFMQLRDIKVRKRVFLIGSSHHTDFNGASIYNIGDYLTPFGRVKVDQKTANKLIEKSEIINFVQVAHAHEHCLEVLLPFIQYFWKNNFEIVPIILATQSKETCKQLANELQDYFNNENLFVISTDLSHYPNYNNAVKVDKLTVDAILSGNPNSLLDQIKLNKKNNIPNLATSMCGWTSVLTLMYLALEMPNSKYVPILYQNSGNAKQFTDTGRVVGYQSIALTRNLTTKS
jgi:MEMO1 family protein